MGAPHGEFFRLFSSIYMFPLVIEPQASCEIKILPIRLPPEKNLIKLFPAWTKETNVVLGVHIGKEQKIKKKFYLRLHLC